jgi:hypothetical protein
VEIEATDSFTFTERTPNTAFSDSDSGIGTDLINDHPNVADKTDTDSFGVTYGTDTWPHAFKSSAESGTLSESGMIEATASDVGVATDTLGDMLLEVTEGSEF